MKRWLVKLVAEPQDLEEFPRCFPTGDSYAVVEDQDVYLTGPRFDTFSTATEVREIAAEVLDEFAAIVYLLWPSLQRPAIGDVYQENEAGDRSRHLFSSAHDALRLKDSASATGGSTKGTQNVPTDAQVLLAASRRAPRAQAAVMLWADSPCTWPRLYRVLEELELQLKTTVSKANLCSDSQRERFTRSANAAEVAGKDSRHAGGKFQPPKNPMSLQEAASFMSSLIQATLRRVHEESIAKNAV